MTSQHDMSKSAGQPKKITKVYTVDHHVMNILGIYCEYKTIVTGN